MGMTIEEKRRRVRHVTETMIQEVGLINITRIDLCERAGIPDGSFLHIMGCSFSDFISTFNKSVNNHHARVKSRVLPEQRRQQILLVAVDLAIKHGYIKLTRQQIAQQAGVTDSLVTKYFSTMPKLRRDILRYAVRNEILPVIAQGLANNDPHVKKASEALKIRARNSI